MRLIDLGHPEPEEYAWDRRAGVTLAEGSVDAVCLEDHLVERSVRAGMAAMADLGALVDIGIVLGQHADVIDWEYVATRARRGGIYAAFVTVIREVCTLFNMPDASRRIPDAGGLSSGIIRRWWRLERIDYAELSSPRAGRFRFGLVASTSPFSAARWLWRHLAPRRRWVRNLLGGRPSLWRWLKFLLIARDFPVHAGVPAPHIQTRPAGEGSVTSIDIKPGKRP